MSLRMVTTLSLIAGIFLSLTVFAETIEFPEEELPTESVLPVFDKTVVVRERAVKTTGRFEVGVGTGLNLAEPLYSQTVFNITGTYHLDETNGINVTALFLSSSLSQAGQDLKSGDVPPAGKVFDASLAPTVQEMLFGNYQLTAYYGKVSVTKQTVMNLSLYGLAGAGLVQWSDHSTFGFDVGFGQKLYFTPHQGIRFDMILAMYTGPDPTNPSNPTKKLESTTGKLSSSDFSSTYYMRPFMTLAYVYLF